MSVLIGCILYDAKLSGYTVSIHDSFCSMRIQWDGQVMAVVYSQKGLEYAIFAQYFETELVHSTALNIPMHFPTSSGMITWLSVGIVDQSVLIVWIAA